MFSPSIYFPFRILKCRTLNYMDITEVKMRKTDELQAVLFFGTV